MRDSLDALHTRLVDFHGVGEFCRIVNDARLALGSRTVMRQAGLAWLKEACSAGAFATLRGASHVRLISAAEERPDIAVLIRDVEERYEVIEADRAGRRRGDEYASPDCEPGIAEDIEEVEELTAEQVADVVRRAAEKKTQKARTLSVQGKPYPAGTNLLISVNVWSFFCDPDEAVALFPDAVVDARPWFTTVWTLWDGAARKV